MHSLTGIQSHLIALNIITQTAKLTPIPPQNFFTPIRLNGLQFRRKVPAFLSCSIKTTPRATLSDSADFEIMERDWSFLEKNSSNGKMKRVVDAAQVEQDSRAVVCLGTQKFVDYLCMTTPCVLSVMHYSLLELANIKEKHDSVKCRQGDIVGMPSSLPLLDVVFINCLPALNHPLPRILDAVVRRCVPGARLIISDTQGRDQLRVHKKDNPDVITGDLPDRLELEKVLRRYPLQLISFSDEADFYLAVLKVYEDENSKA